VSPDQLLTRLEIPKIQMDAIVVEGASRRELSEGPGHMKQTAQPGETGNAVITAHRDTFFRHIYELNRGDQIKVRRSGRLFTYEVTGKRIVMPEDVSVIKLTNDPQLTLITCYPTYYIGPAPKRLVVFSKLVDTDGQPVNQAAQAHSNRQ
ncbi:MAG TPA: class D sortase, partial [Candidatus Angelobacter sp.]|nr:class D sortase [Candidatus Angelobacter sp.]